LFNTIGTVLLIALTALTLGAIIFAEPLIAVAAPGFSGEQRTLTVRLLRIVMPTFLLLGMSTLTTATLNAWKRFTRPALADASYRAGPLVLLLAVGTVPAMAVGAVIGALGKLLIEAQGLGRKLGFVRPSFDIRFPPVRTVLRLAAPLLAGLAFSLFVVPLVENAFASRTGVGGVTALAFARKIVETLAAILPYTLGLVLLPFSSEMAADRDEGALARTLTMAVRALALIFVPVTIGLMVLREPFIQLLFERGAFTAASTQLTAGPLLFYALALLPFAMEVIVIQFFFARQDTLTPVLTDVAAFALNVALIPPLLNVLGLGGIALAAAIGRTAKVLALLVIFARRVPAFRLGSLVRFTAQMAVAALAAATALIGLSLLMPEAQGREFVATVIALCAGALVGASVFYVAAYLLGVEEMRELPRRAREWIRAR
jgi:putative peptidoglycan lipid II flippase